MRSHDGTAEELKEAQAALAARGDQLAAATAELEATRGKLAEATAAMEDAHEQLSELQVGDMKGEAGQLWCWGEVQLRQVDMWMNTCAPQHGISQGPTRASCSPQLKLLFLLLQCLLSGPPVCC